MCGTQTVSYYIVYIYHLSSYGSYLYVLRILVKKTYTSNILQTIFAEHIA